MPVLFVGHGNPMNGISRNRYADGWRSVAAALPRPRAVLAVSAHWYTRGTRVTAMERPRTIHDFGGFPPELYAVEYPAPGDPELADRVAGLLRPTAVQKDDSWGLDHGTWSVLVHMFSQADIPVVQLSMDRTQPAAWHYELGARLSPLRDQGVLILASGNLVHNLHAYSWGRHPVEPFDWALEFEGKVRGLLAARDHAPLVAYQTLGPAAGLSVPTPDHYLPLLYALAVRRSGDQVSYPVEGFDGGSVSMLSVRIG